MDRLLHYVYPESRPGRTYSGNMQLPKTWTQFRIDMFAQSRDLNVHGSNVLSYTTVHSEPKNKSNIIMCRLSNI